jgi:UDP-N-acetylmuramoyl-tripeptide--D-alanyl-D-alanine ligase
VAVVDGAVLLHGDLLAKVEEANAPPTNVACAVAVALELGVPPEAVAARLTSLPATEHRQTVGVGAGRFTIVDDTYNANPAGAARALELLAAQAGPGGKRVVVTPGLVELGPRQLEENQRFAAAAAGVATHVVVVGHTNRAALLRGAGAAETLTVEVRDDAVAWVRANLGPGDAVLYENDLPDHYP